MEKLKIAHIDVITSILLLTVVFIFTENRFIVNADIKTMITMSFFIYAKYIIYNNYYNLII